MRPRAATRARDDQVLAAAHELACLTTCLELACLLNGDNGYAIYAQVYNSLTRLEREGLVCRCRFVGSQYTFWQPVGRPVDLSSMEWSSSSDGQ